jgi:hypothetical protein
MTLPLVAAAARHGRRKRHLIGPGRGDSAKSPVQYLCGKPDARGPAADHNSEVMNLLAAPAFRATLRDDPGTGGRYLQS